MTQTALVTGASSGIGAGFAEALAARGMSVVLVARSADKLEALATTLRQRHGDGAAHVVPADLGLPGAADALKAELDGRGLVIDLLVNNAGFGAAGAFHKAPAVRSAGMVALNVAAVVELCAAFLPGMVERRRGGVLNVASTAAFQPLPGMALYAATKAFVLSFSEGLAEEVRGKGVTVTALCPGPVDTPFFEAADAKNLRSKVPSALMMTTSQVIAAALDGLDHGRAVVVPGLPNKLTSVLPRFVPRRLMAFASGRLMGR